MTPANLAAQFGDTTYTKVFVGGLAWETQKDTLKKHFEQFGDILEAVVITDKTTGRSKGYGFVTFREPDVAMKACVDATPVIDGRRANCNLASLGLQRSKPSTPKHGGGGRNIRKLGAFHQASDGMAAAFATAATLPHYSIQQGIPYNLYGYSPYSAEYAYPTSYYGVYGGASLYGCGTSGLVSSAGGAYYPYLNFSEGSRGGPTSYSLQYPHHHHHHHHHLFQYSSINSSGLYPQHYGTPISLAPPSTPLQSAGVTISGAPIPHR